MPTDRLPTQAELDEAISNAREADELRSAEGAIAAVFPCDRHCAVCEGHDHHWLPECDDLGEPIMVCKHCPAWREMSDDDELV